MNRALLLVAGWVGQGLALWLRTLRRPLAAEVAALRDRLEKLRSENDLLRARLERIEPHRRPFYTPSERLRILLHRARYGISVRTTARLFAISGQSVVNWLKDAKQGLTRVVRSRDLGWVTILAGSASRLLDPPSSDSFAGLPPGPRPSSANLARMDRWWRARN